MPVTIRDNEDDYIIYEVLCDYCDKEYTIKYDGDIMPRQAIECCAFCSNLVEETTEGIYDDEDSWD